MQASLNTFDTLLQESDSDSMDWADGGSAERAAAALEALPEQDWSALRSLCSSREAKWRACFVSLLRPQQGEQAQHLMFALASDPDDEVAFLAVSGIAFYCGINDSAQGPFIDLTIRVPSFVTRARATAGLVAQIRSVSSSCAPNFQTRFELLAAELESSA